MLRVGQSVGRRTSDCSRGYEDCGSLHSLCNSPTFNAQFQLQHRTSSLSNSNIVMFGMFQMRNWRGHRLWCLKSRRRHVGPPSIMISPTPTKRIDLLLQNVLQSPLREKKSTKGSRRARLNRTHRPLSIQPMISQVLQLGVGGSLVIAALHWYFRNPPPPP